MTATPRLARLGIGTIAAALCIGAGAASAQTTTDESTDPLASGQDPGEQPAATEPEGSGGETGDAATEPAGDTQSGDGAARESRPLRLTRENVDRKRVFYAGKRKVVFKFEIGGDTRRDVKVEVVRKGSGKVMRRWRKDGVRPGERRSVRWGGSRSGGGESPKGKYRFRVRDTSTGQLADRSRTKGSRGFSLYPTIFPVRARHSYGDGYGAGRGHRGVDVFAKCGAKLVAARAGRVQYKAYQGGGAGYYVVIDGKGQNKDYVYMHLKRRAAVREGKRVRAGETIGRVGQSGNASGCHLHFELWKGQWYGGGSPMRNVKKQVRRWDGWS